jgi:hypothetical protein
MRRLTILISIIALLASSCQNRRPNKSLAEVDSLVVAELYDSAYHLVTTKLESANFTPEEQAHYDLLKVQTSILANKPLESSDSILDGVISYYNQHVNHERLADAYYYKAICAYKAKDPQQSIMLYKKAELHAKQSGNLYQKFKIAEGISFVNGKCANYDFLLKYAKQALDLAKRVNNKKWIAYSYYRMGLAHSKSGNKDSASYFLHQMETYSKFINEKELPLFFSNIG